MVAPAFTIRRGSTRLLLGLGLALLTLGSGCRAWNPLGAKGPPTKIENPLFVPALDREFLWNQTVDVVDDYFRIEREERVRLIGGVLTEGRIDTIPKVGATIFEPWKRDSTPGYEKWHATLQSIRRRATVRVIPSEGGYLVDVQVLKELEDMDKPENATAGGATLRHDGTLIRQVGPAGRYSVNLGWISKGRDCSLEQEMLAQLSGRLNLTGDLVRLPATEESPLLLNDSQPSTTIPESLPRSAPRESNRPLNDQLETLPAPAGVRP